MNPKPTSALTATPHLPHDLSGAGLEPQDFLRLFENLPLGVAICAVHGHDSDTPLDMVVKQANAAFAAHTGLAPEAFVGHSLHKLFSDEDTGPIVEAAAQACNSGETARFQRHIAALSRTIRATITPLTRDRVAFQFEQVSTPNDESTDTRQVEDLCAFVQQSPAARAIFDTKMRYLAASPRWCSDYGVELKSIVGRSHYAVFPEIEARWRKIHRRCLAGESLSCDEDHFERADGTVQWLRWEVIPWHVGGTIGGVLMYTEDVSGQKRAERSLALFRKLLDQSTDSIEVIDPSTGRFLDANETAYASLGYTREEFLALRVMDIDPDTDEAVFATKVAMVRAAGQAVFERTHRNCDGRDIPVEVNARYVSLDRDYIIAIVRDLRPRTELNEKVDLLFKALDAAANGMVIANCTGEIEWVNPTFTRMIGDRPEEVIGRNMGDFIRSAVDGPKRYAEVCETVSRGEVWAGELLHHRGDGAIVHLYQTITPVTKATGEISHYVGVLSDITERRELEQELAQAQKMESVGRLAGGVAHDFNNLLTVICGYADMLQANQDYGPELQRGLHEISENGKRAAVLTRQLLAFSRRQVLRPKVIHLGYVISDCTKMLGRLVGEDIAFEVNADTGLWKVYADPGQVEQVVTNLVVNARDAMPRGGQLSIGISNARIEEAPPAVHADLEPGDYVCVTVSDTGSGIDETIIEDIFEPFFTTKETGKGTGLGLATVYGIVKQSGGCIFVDSKLGEGTTFKIFLPRVAGEAEQGAGTTTKDAVRGGNETILLVEDEPALRKLAERILTQAGYQVISAANGAEALAEADTHGGAINLIVTDVIMPGKGGRELVQDLAERGIRPAVLYMSGYTDSTIAAHGILEDGVNLLSKPFSATQLTAKVRALLDASQETQA